MAEYIERERALTAIKFAELGQEYEAVESIPAADVVKVIRCKDCYWLKVNPDIGKIGEPILKLIYEAIERGEKRIGSCNHLNDDVWWCKVDGYCDNGKPRDPNELYDIEWNMRIRREREIYGI